MGQPQGLTLDGRDTHSNLSRALVASHCPLPWEHEQSQKVDSLAGWEDSGKA